MKEVPLERCGVYNEYDVYRVIIDSRYEAWIVNGLGGCFPFCDVGYNLGEDTGFKRIRIERGKAYYFREWIDWFGSIEEHSVSDQYFYYVNTGRWQNVYCFTWKSDTLQTPGDWPGNKMELCGSYNGYELYRYHIDPTYDIVVFNSIYEGATVMTKSEGVKIERGMAYYIDHWIDIDGRITVQGEKFDHNLQYFAQYLDSTVYDPELAHLMMTMASAAYTQSNVERGYQQLGLTGYNDEFYDEIFADYGTEKAPFSMGYVKNDNGTICVLVTIRGSGNPFDIYHGSMDWLGNISLKTIDEYGLVVNENFYNTMQNVYNALDEYTQLCFNKHIQQLDNAKFFVTGHSRGGAVGNLLEIKLGKTVGKENVYGYNYAVPDYVKAKRTHSLSNGYENIFNLSHLQDIVSYLPGLIVEPMASTKQWFDDGTVDRYSKLGNTVWFDDGQLDEIGPESHIDGQKYYIDYLRNRYSISDYTDNPTIHTKVYGGSFAVTGFKYYATYCPVDVELVDESGTVIASVINGVADYHGSHFGDVIIITEGDHKMIARRVLSRVFSTKVVIPISYKATKPSMGFEWVYRRL